MTSDRRTLLARPDLADLRLEGEVRAERYAAVSPMRCRVAVAAIRAAPDDGAGQEDQLLLGEGFDVLEAKDGWAWGQARRDGYVGFVRADALADAGAAPTHRIAALRTFGFSRPDLKSPPVGAYDMNSLVAAGKAQGGFVDAGAAGWIYAAHLAAIGEFESDPVAVAERYLGAPYLWGGRGSIGLDCSGLVMQAMFACGRACPRDTDQQQAFFAKDAPSGALTRGDLVFWKGHMAMMLDGERIIHANAWHMAVAIEPLAEAVSRIEAAGVGAPTAFRRP